MDICSKEIIAGVIIGSFITTMTGWYWFDEIMPSWAAFGAVFGGIFSALFGRSFIDIMKLWFDFPIN